MPLNRLLLWMLLIFVGSAAAGEWWDDKPYTEWAAEQTEKILNSSPWVVLCPAEPPKQTAGFVRALYVPVYYQVRLLTARPVREGFLRMISLGLPGAAVDIENISGRYAKVEDDRNYMQEFLKSHPNDLRVKADERHIVLCVTLKIAVLEPSPVIRTASVYPNYQELTNAGQLSNIYPSRIHKDTSLTTGSGERIPLLDYAMPGADRLGMKFYFPRHSPDGKPLVAAGARELVFQTRMNDTMIKAKFDLRKMLYKSKLEF